ncbi:hypothetical protein [Salinihabitans flavidus]|uniref:hypothetical protein n=1 Tax=Salinihabitans flavidus TaxID=569882 RepID=UPI0011143171|nr:hypothetical protein [Salinihabitans flavidus]
MADIIETVFDQEGPLPPEEWGTWKRCWNGKRGYREYEIHRPDGGTFSATWKRNEWGPVEKVLVNRCHQFSDAPPSEFEAIKSLIPPKGAEWEYHSCAGNGGSWWVRDRTIVAR